MAGREPDLEGEAGKRAILGRDAAGLRAFYDRYFRPLYASCWLRNAHAVHRARRVPREAAPHVGVGEVRERRALGRALDARRWQGSRQIKGTTDWTRYEIVLDVAQEATALSFGILTVGGTVWLDDVAFEVVDASVPTTDMIGGAAGSPPAEPQNLGSRSAAS